MRPDLEDRIVERVAQLLVERLLGDESPSTRLSRSGKPDGLADPKPLVDEDGDLRCECGRVFVTPGAFKQHRTKMHGGGQR